MKIARRMLVPVLGLLVLSSAAPSFADNLPSLEEAEAVAGARAQAAAAGLKAKSDSRRELLLAADRGDAAAVSALLAAKVNPNVRTNSGMTPMMLASIHGDSPNFVRTVRALIKAGADRNARDYFQRTALYYAAGTGNVAIARALIAAGAEVYLCEQNGRTPLMQAAFDNDLAMVRVLVEEGHAEINDKDDGHWTALMYAEFTDAFSDYHHVARGDVHATAAYLRSKGGQRSFWARWPYGWPPRNVFPGQPSPAPASRNPAPKP